MEQTYHMSYDSKLDLFVGNNNIWSQIFMKSQKSTGNGALFLDRDGVIVEEVEYLHEVNKISLIPEINPLIKFANLLSIPVIIITNQSGIGRGYYSWDDFYKVQNTILKILENAGVTIDAVFACPHHKEAIARFRHADHPCRKPNPGMLKMAAELMKIDLSKSWVIGDRSTDILAGLNANCKGGVHVQTGHGGNNDEIQASLQIRKPNYYVTSVTSLNEITGDQLFGKKHMGTIHHRIHTH